MLIPPLSASEFALLRENIAAERIRDPILIWNGIIIDGHNRYQIAQELNLQFPYQEISFASIEDAKLWIIRNQMGRRNISDYERCRLALLLKASVTAEAQKRQLAGKAPDPVQNSAEGGTTRDIWAKIAGVSHDTLSKVEKLALAADDDMKSKLRAGIISINKAWGMLHPKTTHKPVPTDYSRDTLIATLQNFSPAKDITTFNCEQELDTVRALRKQLQSYERYLKTKKTQAVAANDVEATPTEPAEPTVTEPVTSTEVEDSQAGSTVTDTISETVETIDGDSASIVAEVPSEVLDSPSSETVEVSDMHTSPLDFAVQEKPHAQKSSCLNPFIDFYRRRKELRTEPLTEKEDSQKDNIQ